MMILLKAAVSLGFFGVNDNRGIYSSFQSSRSVTLKNKLDLIQFETDDLQNILMDTDSPENRRIKRTCPFKVVMANLLASR